MNGIKVKKVMIEVNGQKQTLLSEALRQKADKFTESFISNMSGPQ